MLKNVKIHEDLKNKTLENRTTQAGGIGVKLRTSQDGINRIFIWHELLECYILFLKYESRRDLIAILNRIIKRKVKYE